VKKTNPILAVLVVYNIKIDDSIAYQTFIKYKEHCKQPISLFVVDNSETVSAPQEGNKDIFLYVHLANKEMLSGAYNAALKVANSHKYNWLLLLDQDTLLSAEYFIKLNDFFENVNDLQDITAIVPFLKQSNKIISPHRLHKNIWFDKKISTYGIQYGHIIAFNSMSLLRTDFLNSVNGFSPKFPLDMLDHWLYLQMFRQKKQVYILNTEIEHQLSVSSYSDSVSIARHRMILDAEKNITKELGLFYYLSYKFRLSFRMFKQFFCIKNKSYALLDFKTLLGLR
jgi:GT2 family glycosyltransferase